MDTWNKFFMDADGADAGGGGETPRLAEKARAMANPKTSLALARAAKETIRLQVEKVAAMLAVAKVRRRCLKATSLIWAKGLRLLTSRKQRLPP